MRLLAAAPALLVLACAPAPPRPAGAALAAPICPSSAAPAAPPAPAAPDPSPWARLTEVDLVAIRDLLLADHPGPHDPANPAFSRWMQEGFPPALERARAAGSFDAYAASLAMFVAGFHDGHLGITFEVARSTSRWPGIIVALRGGKYVVREVAPADAGFAGLPPPGSQLLACDGQTPEALLRRDVFPRAVGHSDRLEASWTILAPRLLVDSQDPLRARPERCVFQTGAGPREVALDFRPIERAALGKKLADAAFGEAPPFAIRPFGADGVWASMPTFAPDREGEKVLARIAAEAPRWRGKRVVVLDVRGNQGGNSGHGNGLLRSFYGELRGDPSDAGVSVEWRASPGNLQHLEGLIPEITRSFGEGSEVLAWARQVTEGMRRAVARKESLYREDAARDTPAPGSAAGKLAPEALRPRVFLVTDGRCASACLDFVDAALRYPNVTHVGAPTSADTPYMENRSVALPGAIARLSFGIKVYRNRPRSGHAFVPGHRFDGEMGDTAALERWIAGLARGRAP